MLSLQYVNVLQGLRLPWPLDAVPHFPIVAAVVFYYCVSLPISKEHTPYFRVLCPELTAQYLTNKWLKPSRFLIREWASPLHEGGIGVKRSTSLRDEIEKP